MAAWAWEPARAEEEKEMVSERGEAPTQGTHPVR